MGVMDATGQVRPDVANWIGAVCYCEQWLELRYVGPSMQIMRGFVARRGGATVVALRNALDAEGVDVVAEFARLFGPAEGVVFGAA